MKRRLLVLAALLCLAVSLAVPACAIEYAGFSDVDDGTAHSAAIRWAAEQGYVNSYPDGRFGVNDPVTRAQLASIFYRAAGSPSVPGASRFPDVQAGAYYADAAVWAEDSGLIGGYPDGRYGVDDPVTRQQVVTILWRWAESPTASGEDYADESTVAAYAQTAVDWSQSNSILAGREDGRFAPNESATARRSFPHYISTEPSPIPKVRGIRNLLKPRRELCRSCKLKRADKSLPLHCWITPPRGLCWSVCP